MINTLANINVSVVMNFRTATGPVYDFDIFVSNTGSDSNDGLSATSPKLTIAAAEALITNGSRIGIHKGSHFREQLNITETNVTVGSYGESGDAPILDASNVVSSFTKTAARTNVYQFSHTHNITAVATNFFTIWENGQRLKRVTSEALCDSTPGSFYAPTPAASAQTIFFHPIGSTNPTSDGKTYEVTKRDYAIFSSTAATGLTVDGIYCKRCAANDGSIVINGTGSTITNVTAEDGQKHNFFVTDNCLVEDCTAIKEEGIDSLFIYYKSSATGSVGTTFRRCSAIGGYAYGEESAKYPTTTGFFCHSGSGTLAAMTMEDCYAENMAGGFNGDATTLNITRCSTYLVATAAGPQTGGSGRIVNITDCFFDQRAPNSYQKAQGAGRNLIQVSQGTITITGCVLVVDPSTWGGLIYSSDNNTVMTITNNTFVAQSGAASFAGLYKNGTGLATLTKNIFYGIGDIFVCDDTDLNVSCNENVYYRTSGNLVFRQGGTNYTGLAAWQATGQDAQGLNTNPSFANAISGWDEVADATPTAASVVTLQAGATY
jgi:hypothetical protein